MKKTFPLFVVHTAVWTLLVLTLAGEDRVTYDMLGSASTPWVRQFVIALLVILAIQVAFITREKWWSEVLRDRPRSAKLRTWIPAMFIVLVVVVKLANEGISDAPASYWVGMTMTMALVGITEELTFRGIVVVGARRQWGDERKALLWSSALFGLFHFPNWWFGQDLGVTLRQVVFTAIMGMAFYSLRRASGMLVVCIILHAAYDWVLIQSAFG